jgi:putative oxidoreductase
MPLNASFAAGWAPHAQGLLRIVAAYLFLLHGSAKLLQVPHVAYFDNLQLVSLIGLAGLLEVVVRGDHSRERAPRICVEAEPFL